MNILISWTGLTGYTGDCWRALVALSGVRLKVFVERTAMDQEFRPDRELAGLDYRMLDRGCVPSARDEEEVAAFAPDVMLIVGWRAASCRWFACHPRWQSVKKVLVCDMPFAWTLRKIAARFVLRSYLRHFSAAFVPGASTERYMRWLAFVDQRLIFTGLNATNLKRFEALIPFQEQPRFLYVGRYSQEKGLSDLMKAYRIYRTRVKNPWPLDCAGMGVCAGVLAGVPGVTDLGFIPPGELAAVFAAHTALLLASLSEPWGQVLVEAAGAGLPIICTDVCGAHTSVVRENGFVVPVHDVAAFAEKMVVLHQMQASARLEMGARGRAWVREFSCEAWAQRVQNLCRCVLGTKNEEGSCLKN